MGSISESDVTLATASNAFIVAFNVRANAQEKAAATRDKLEIRYYSIIYNGLHCAITNTFYGTHSKSYRIVFIY